MNRKLIKPALMGVIALSTVFILQRNRQKKAEAEAAPPPAAEAPAPTEIPVEEAQLQAEAPQPTATPEPEVSLQRGSTRQEVLQVLGEPTGAMVISGVERLYDDEIEIHIKQGVVVRIPDDLSTARKASSVAEEKRSQVVAEREAQKQAAKVAVAKKQTSQPNLVIKNGGQRVDLNTLVGKGSVTIVDFYADWCGPCRQMEPHLKKLAQDPNVNLINIDIVSWDTKVSQQHNVRNIPDVRVFDPSGKQVGSRTHDLRKIQRNVEKAKKRL